MEGRRRRIHYTSGFAFRHVSKSSYYLIAILSYDHINIAAAGAVCRELAYMGSIARLESIDRIDSNRSIDRIDSNRFESNRSIDSKSTRSIESIRIESIDRSIESIRSIESNRLESNRSMDSKWFRSIESIDRSNRIRIESERYRVVEYRLHHLNSFMALILHDTSYCHASDLIRS